MFAGLFLFAGLLFTLRDLFRRKASDESFPLRLPSLPALTLQSPFSAIRCVPLDCISALAELKSEKEQKRGKNKVLSSSLFVCHHQFNIGEKRKNSRLPLWRVPPSAPLSSAYPLTTTTPVVSLLCLSPQSPRKLEIYFSTAQGSTKRGRAREKGVWREQRQKPWRKKTAALAASPCFFFEHRKRKKKRCPPPRTAALPPQTPPSSSPQWARQGPPRTEEAEAEVEAKPPPPPPRSRSRRRRRRSRRRRSSSLPAAPPPATPASPTRLSPLLGLLFLPHPPLRKQGLRAPR